MKVRIYSRQEIEKIIVSGDFPQNTAVISFYDHSIKKTDRNYSPVDYSKVCNRVFYIELDDMGFEDIKDSGSTYNLFFSEVDEIAGFIYSAYEQGMDIICQCEYGQSRSAGCAAAILEYFYHNGISVFADYRYYPNKVIYHKIYDALSNMNRMG